MIGYLAFRIYEEFLDLNASTTVGIEINSPLFNFEATKGTITYPITLPFTKKNQRLLGFPEILSNETAAPIEIPCQYYLMGILWKIGVLRYRGFTGRAYSVNFQSDAGDFSSLTRDRLLTNLDLGSAALSTGVSDIYPAASYALFPIRNADFYGDKRPSYNKYLNYFDGAFSLANSPVVPFPYLPYIFHKVIESHGYYLSGSWLSEEDVMRTVIYNTRSLDAATTITFNNHVPEMKVGEFMQAVRSKFALAYLFDANTKTIRIVKLKDVIADASYIDWTKKADIEYTDEPVDNAGFTLEQQIESADELNKTLSTSWAQYKVGKGRENITTAASTLHMIREQDTVKTSRSWLIPATSQKGNSSQFDTGENKFSLRLIKYYGLQKDSLNADYPLGSAISQNYAGAALTGNHLQWQGAAGVYENNYAAYLDFLSHARPIERGIRLNIADLVTLDPTKKVMIEGIKAFWSKITLSVSVKDGIGKAKVEFLKTKL